MSTREELLEFYRLVDKYRYDYCRLLYIIFPFGQKGHELEHYKPYDWQMEELAKLSVHMQDPKTCYQTYRLIISSGNGAAKTAFGAMLTMMLFYTQRLKGRITANTMPQMTSIIWPEYDLWFQRARYVHEHFEKFGTSIKAKDAVKAESWRMDVVTWNEQSPQAMSGLHNKGGCVLYTFEEAPGIPSVIWQYASGAFTETETRKIFLAFGNSDDPNSQFEQNMESNLWHTRRIDTRTLEHIDKDEIAARLQEAQGDEENDDFRVRVRGLPRKTAADAIINVENVRAAIARAKDFDKKSVAMLPCVIAVDPAWTGGDETVISYQQGNYRCVLERYKLDKINRETHDLTYRKVSNWEKTLNADAVFVDQGEGTALYTLATNAGKTNWFLIAFNSSPNDAPEPKDSEYSNIRAQMYYETNKFFYEGGVLDAVKKEDLAVLEKQLSVAKGGRHQTTGKKKVEPKKDIKARVGYSPDVADSIILCGAIKIIDRLPENDISYDRDDRFQVGQGAYRMPDHGSPYNDMEVDSRDLYD